MSDNRGGYGAIPDNSNGRAQGNADEENAPLLGTRKDIKAPIHHRVRSHMVKDIDKKRGDLVLFVCYVITGLLDSSSISIWGSFVSMQTGNTVYLGLGLADPYGGKRWIKALTSLGFFCVGSFVFARYHRFFTPIKRWVLFSSYLIQLICIVGAASIVTFEKNNDSENELRWEVLVPIGLVAFNAGGQAVSSRALKFNALTSVVLTSIYCDLFSDANIFAGFSQNVDRNQRTAAPISLLIGAIGGGLWSKSAFGIAGALWSAAALKLLLVLAWLLWKPMKDQTR